MGQAFSGLDCCRSRDSSKKAEKKKSSSDHSNSKNEAVFKHLDNEIKEEAIEEEDEKLQAKPSSETCTGPKKSEINESHQETKESPLEKKPDNIKIEQNEPKIENNVQKIENGEKSENNEKRGENNGKNEQNVEKKENPETSPLKIPVENENEKKGMENEDYKEKLAKRKAEFDKKLEASKHESQTLKVNNPELENEKRKSANSEELKEKMAKIKAELEKKSKHEEVSKEKPIKIHENKEKATEKNNNSPLKLNKEEHKETISSEAEKKENTETNKNTEEDKYKEKLAKRKAEFEKKTKLEGANKESAAAKLAQMKQAMAAKNSQNNNNNNQTTDNHNKITENATHSATLNNENQKVETEAVELKGEKTERKEKVKKSANIKKPQTEEDFERYSEVKPYYKSNPSENSSKTETFIENVSILEKETELPKEQGNFEVKNKPEEQKTELDSSRLLTHYIKKQLETIPENSLAESPREMVTKFINTSPGKRINKNLMERVKMLENLLGSQNAANNGDSEEMISDRTQSDNTFDVRLFRTYDPSRYKKQNTDGAAIALEHVTLERSPAKHLKTKSSLLYKSLDLNDLG